MTVSTADARAIVERACARPDVLDACARRDLGAVIDVLGAAGLTQGRIAELTGISQGRLSEWRTGKRKALAVATFQKFADGLGLPTAARRALGLDWNSSPNTASAMSSRPSWPPWPARAAGPAGTARTPTSCPVPTRTTWPWRTAHQRSWPMRRSGCPGCCRPRRTRPVGSLAILHYPQAPGLGVVHLGGATGGTCLESTADLAAHARVFEQLRAFALSPAQSALLLRGLADT